MKIEEPRELLKKIYKKTNKNDIFIIAVVFILGLINNFSFIITDGIAPDALSPAEFNVAGNWEISLGRFGIKFVNLMRFGLVNKFIIILICLLFLAIASVVIARTFEIKDKILIFLVSAIIAVAPQFTETYMFIYCADAYCFAFLFATLAVYFLKRADNEKKYYLFTIICTIITCSLYQAYLGVLIGETILLLIDYLLKDKKVKDVFIKALKYVLAIFVGIILYYIILQLIISMLGISLASYKGANNLGITTIKNLPKTILQTYKDFFNFFFTDKIIKNSYWNRDIINIIIFSTSFVGLVFALLKNKYNSKIIRTLFVILLLGIFPIGIGIMDVIAPNTTTNLVTGPGLIISILLIFLIYNKLNNNSLENIIKYGEIALISLLIFTYILGNTFTYMCRQRTFENYYTISNDIYSRVVQLENYSSEKKWMFSDVIRYYARDTNRSNGFISADNETWNNYSGTLQNSSFYEKYLGIKIKICSKDEYKEIVKTDEFKKMPVYPNKGSIKIINNIIVIKVSDKTF